MIDFAKMHGTGNDFVVIADLDDRIVLDERLAARICDRHYGIGADGVIRIGSSRHAPFFMDYRNPDGSLAEMCGNGVRVVGKWLGDRGHATDNVSLDTRDGVKELVLHRPENGEVCSVTVDMGLPRYEGEPTETLICGNEQFVVSTLSMGNPHAVLFVDDVDAVPLEFVGPLIQAQKERFPDGVNVELAAVQAGGVIRERTYERGAGETLACGTGACAVAVAAQRRGLAGKRLEVELRGGSLVLEWTPGNNVFMTGPAVEVFSGTFHPDDFSVAPRA